MEIMKPKVIFYNPKSTSVGKEPLPISLLQLAAQIENAVDWSLVDGNYARTPEAAVEAIAAETDNPAKTLLAVTVMPGPQLAQALPVCKEIRARFPEVHMIWGGYFPTQHYRLILESGMVDAVARGPADLTFRHYVQAWMDGRKEDIQGFVTRESLDHGKVTKGQYPDPNQLPELPYDRVPMDRYIHPNFLGEACIGYHSSDGCPFTCSFCAVVALADGHWKGQSAERVAQTLFHLQDTYGIDSVQFFDNNFFVSQRRCLAFAERLLESGRKITWWGEGRIDTLLNWQRSTLEKMHASGLKMVFMGAEASNEETLALYEKGGTLKPSDTLALTQLFKEIGIIPEYSFVLGNPRDSVEQLKRDFDYILQIKEIYPRTEIILYLYTPVVLPGKLSDEAASAGFAYPKRLEDFVSGSWLDLERRRSSILPWGQQGHHTRITDFETVLNAYYPTATDMYLKGWQRTLLQALSTWRFKLKVFRSPLELRLIQRAMRYMRPEVEGF